MSDIRFFDNGDNGMFVDGGNGDVPRLATSIELRLRALLAAKEKELDELLNGPEGNIEARAIVRAEAAEALLAKRDERVRGLEVRVGALLDHAQRLEPHHAELCEVCKEESI